MSLRRVNLLMAVCLVLGLVGSARAVERFPPPDFESGHRLPDMGQPAPESGAADVVSVAALLVALALAAWLALKARSRRGMVLLSLACLAYFGFWRGGCVCPIGAIQNVARGLADPAFVLPATVIATFLLPLVFALFFGRVFCGGVCPLGAIQDVVLVRPIRLPGWLRHALGMVPFLYLGVAVLLAANGAMFVICSADPFVGLFRLSASAPRLLWGAGLLLVGTAIARPYCRFLCPYGAILNLLSRVAWRRTSITPDDCVVCGLCENACPFDAIRSADEEGEDT